MTWFSDDTSHQNRYGLEPNFFSAQINPFQNPVVYQSSTDSYFLTELAPCLVNLTEHRILVRYPDLQITNASPFIYVMDDDLLDWRPLLDIPFPYAFRLWRKVVCCRAWILMSCSELWVSTPYLAQKYAAWNPRLLRPVASGPLLERLWIDSSSDVVRICYHGTWSHRDDMKWLSPVIAEVQRLCSNTIFEVMGGDRVARVFRGIPRVSVLPTMPWPEYLRHTQTVRQDIGLAPLRDTLFNRGRGPIKFFDYARAGAVGVYSAGPAFSDFVSDGVDGFVLENDPALWVDRIVELVHSPDLRQTMTDAAWQKVLANSPASPEIATYLKDLQFAIDRLAS